MTFNELQAFKISAMKSGDKERIKVLNDIIVLVQKEQVKGRTKVEATEEMVAACALKAQKMLEEMVATCPDTPEYAKRRNEYCAQLVIAREYAPQLITDEAEIKNMIWNALGNNIELTKKNKGSVMKIVMPILKGKVNMAVANKVIGEMLQ